MSSSNSDTPRKNMTGGQLEPIKDQLAAGLWAVVVIVTFSLGLLLTMP